MPFENKNDLVAPVTFEEVKGALFDINDEKSRGLDGIGSLFFKKAWDVVGCDVVTAVGEFFKSGRLLKQWNHAFIALVPQSAHANFVTDFRPISCCNVFYKIISKIIANRLGAVIGDIVGEAQTAFIKDRSIVDNIHLAEELFRKYGKNKSSARCIMKVDLQKAYNTVHWDFVGEAMRALDFHETFVGWIMECVTTTSFSISVNGQLHGFFSGKKGLRQGDLYPLTCFPYAWKFCRDL